jgi:site-specific recombinase XerD
MKKSVKQKIKSANPWEDALQSFLLFKKAEGLSERTVFDYKKHVNQFFRRFPNAWENTDTFKSCALEYMGDDIKPATYNLRLNYLKIFFLFSIEEKYIDANPLQKLKKRKAMERIVDVHYSTLQKLLTLPDKNTFSGLRDNALLMFVLDTGIRPKEALNLTLQDFDLKHLVVIVPPEIAKTRTERTLPISPITSKAIAELIRNRHQAWGDNIPVFPTSDGMVMTSESWSRRLVKYSKELGEKVRPYDLRHCFALYYLRNGGNVFSLQKTMGHSTMDMTRRYVAFSSVDVRENHTKASPLGKLMPQRNRVRSL